MKHRRIVVAERGGPEVLHVVEEDVPEPGPGEIRVKTLTAGVSAYDLMLYSHRFPGFPKPPYTPGVDLVGVVDALGDGVDGPEIGRRVGALMGRGSGAYAEFVCLPACDAVCVPEGLDAAEAVCVVANYVTAYAMMHREASVEKGERVLVHGAAGGVGSALLDLGGIAGLETYATASAPNHEWVSSLGATPIDYRNEDFVTRVRALTDGGVDVVFDPIGGARQLWRSSRALRKGGRLIWFGVAATKRRGIRVIPESLVTQAAIGLLPNGKQAPFAPAASTDPNDWYRETLTRLFEWLELGRLNPRVAASVPLTEAARAHEVLLAGGHAGKLVLVAAPDVAESDER